MDKEHPQFIQLQKSKVDRYSYKILVDMLNDTDLKNIATLMHDALEPYGSIYATSKKAVPFAKCFEEWITPGINRVLIVSNVYRTGETMRKAVKNYVERKYPGTDNWVGVVLFARSRPPMRIRYFMMSFY